MTTSLAEHEALLEAILAADPAMAEKAMQDHVASSAANVLDFYLGARDHRPARRRGAA
jgi:DNA-binding GntR family transcriptional regulator